MRLDLKPLTSLRFVAALLVFADHDPLTRPIGERHQLGEAAVSFFFQLSGFILMTTYWQTFDARFTWRDVRSFYVARFARVYPLLFTTTILAALLLSSFGEGIARYGGIPLWNGVDPMERAEKMITTLSLIQPWTKTPSLLLGISPPTWSIGAEAFFYVAFPFAAWYLSRAFSSLPTLLLGVAIAAIWLFDSSVVAALHDTYLPYYSPAIRFNEFAIGMLTAQIFLRERKRSLKRLWSSVVEIAVIGSVTVSFIVMPFFGHIPAGLLLGPLFACTIYVYALAGGTVSQVLSHPILTHLGEASFAFYLIHHPVLEATTSLFGISPLSEAIALATTLIASLALFRYLEAPARLWICGARSASRQAGVIPSEPSPSSKPSAT